MKIEVGKTYRTMLGNKVTIVARFVVSSDYTFLAQLEKSGIRGMYSEDGRVDLTSSAGCPFGDIIAEWAEPSPIRTITRREIVPGTYGIVHLRSESDGGLFVARGNHSPEELRAAVKLFNELADVLDENAGAM